MKHTLELTLPAAMYFCDCHEAYDFLHHLRNLGIKKLRAVEVDVDFCGDYVFMFYAGEITSPENTTFLERLRAEIDKEKEV